MEAGGVSSLEPPHQCTPQLQLQLPLQHHLVSLLLLLVHCCSIKMPADDPIVAKLQEDVDEMLIERNRVDVTIKDMVLLLGKQNAWMHTEMAKTKKSSQTARVRPFSNGDPDDWMIFREHVISCGKINKWDDERSVMELKNAMDGVAAKRVQDVVIPAASQLKEAMDLYESRFVHESDSQLARAAFATCRQKESETALDWHSRCRAIHIRAWRATPDRDTCGELIYHFIQFMHNPYIRRNVTKDNPGTYTLALARAQGMEAVVKSELMHMASDKKGAHSINGVLALTYDEPAVAAFPARPGRNRGGRFEGRPQAEGGQGKACWFCNSPTHLKADCQKYKAEMSGGGGRGRGGRGRGQSRGRGAGRKSRGGFGQRAGQPWRVNAVYEEENQDDRENDRDRSGNA